MNSELIGDNIQLVTISSFTEINKAKEYLISLNKQATDVIKLSKGNYQLSIISEKNLPLVLPEVPNYEPSSDASAPLAKNIDWVEV